MPLVECVPNFSEGRRSEVIEQIVNAMKFAANIKLLDVRADADHNRVVVTFVGEPQACFLAAFAGIKKAAEVIDLDQHKGEHPRIGATDVVPFVPLTGITLEECVDLAKKLGRKVADELKIPVYLYEAAATRPDRENLANLRKGQYEGLKEAIKTDPNREPDFGPKELPKAGATVIGARDFLIAYNIYLNTTDVELAKAVAKSIRFQNGGFRYVKAMGFETKPYVQVSMNMTNFRQTPMPIVVETVRSQANRYGLSITETEVYGMIPLDALMDAAEFYLQLNTKWKRDQIIEVRMDAIRQEESKEIKYHRLIDFIAELASDSPAPGGGSVSCMSGAMAAALGAMVSRLTVGKKGYEDAEHLFSANIEKFDALSRKLADLIDKDANAFNGVIAAMKLPKDTDDQKAVRSAKLQEEYKNAALVPFDTAKTCREVLDLILEMGLRANKNTYSDVAVAALNALTGLKGAILNVEINLPAIKDATFVADMRSKTQHLLENADAEVSNLTSKIRNAF